MIDRPPFPEIVSSFFGGKQVVVIGAAGFIGSHLCGTLLELGATVVGVDNFLTGRRENLDSFKDHANFEFRELDLNAGATAALEGLKPDVVLHFASPASPPRYQAHPVETYLVNTQATHQLLEHLRQHTPQARFLFASTSEVYGDPQVHPQTEDYWGNVNPNGPRSCYDEAKRLGETICGVFRRHYGLDTRIVRIFNTYGPRIDPADGRVIPQFVTELLAGQPYTIYGDGSQTRSYCYVDDLVRGILSLAAHQNGAGQTVNLGNPEELTVVATAKLVHEVGQELGVAKGEYQATHHELPKDDPTRRRPDITKAKELLGWQPEVNVKDGLKKTIQSFLTA